MSSKAVFYLLGLLAIVLFISSQVSARDLAKTISTSEHQSEEAKGDATKVADEKYGFYHGGGGYPHHGSGGGSGGGGYYHHGCQYGCCSHGYSGCNQCCSYAGEKAQVETKPHN